MNTSAPSVGREGIRRFRRRNTADNVKPVEDPNPAMEVPSKSIVMKGGGGFGNLLRAVRHVHQQRESFHYELTVDRLSLRVPRPKKICLEWQRGPNKVLSEHYPTLHKNVWQCSWPKSLEMNVTLFSSVNAKGERKYATKETTIRFLDQATIKQKAPERLGEVTFDLTEVVLSGKPLVIATLPLTKCLDPSARVAFKISAVKVDNESICDDVTWSGGEEDSRAEDETAIKASGQAARMRRVPSLPIIHSPGPEGRSAGLLQRDTHREAPTESINKMSTLVPAARVADGSETLPHEASSEEAQRRTSSGSKAGNDAQRARQEGDRSSTRTGPRTLSPSRAKLPRNGSTNELLSAPPAQSPYQRASTVAVARDSATEVASNPTLLMSSSSMEGNAPREPRLDYGRPYHIRERSDGFDRLESQRRKAETLSDLAGQLAERERLLSQQDKLLNSKERQLQERDRLLSEKDKQIAQCLRQVEDLHASLARQAAIFELDRERLVSESLQKHGGEAKRTTAASDRQLELSEGSRKGGSPSDRAKWNAKIQELQESNKCLQLQLDQALAKAEAERTRFKEKLAALQPQARSPVFSPAHLRSPDSSPLNQLTKSELISKVHRLQCAAAKDGGEAAIIADLEEQLVDAKVRLAQAETEKEELIEKARKRIDALKSTTTEYAGMVETLERKVAELKVQLSENSDHKEKAKSKSGRPASVQQGADTERGSSSGSKWKGIPVIKPGGAAAKKVLRAASATFSGGSDEKKMS